jgi:hypothetical protein
MSKLEVNLSLEHLDADQSPEVLISFVTYVNRVAQTDYTSVVTSSKQNGVYDKVMIRADVDGDGHGSGDVKKDVNDEDDNRALIDLAQAFVKFAKVAGEV